MSETDASHLNSVPPNVEFRIDDLEEEWVFHAPFDFIYIRCLAGSIRNWPRMMQQAFEYVLTLQMDIWITLTFHAR